MAQGGESGIMGAKGREMNKEKLGEILYHLVLNYVTDDLIDKINSVIHHYDKIRILKRIARGDFQELNEEEKGLVIKDSCSQAVILYRRRTSETLPFSIMAIEAFKHHFDASFNLQKPDFGFDQKINFHKACLKRACMNIFE